MKKVASKFVLLLPIPIFLITLCIGSYYIPVSKVIDLIMYKISGYTVFHSTRRSHEKNKESSRNKFLL